jgi:N-acyl-D-amino-acid deacylase
MCKGFGLIETPTILKDVPTDMPRLMQTTHGHVATFVSGEIIQEHGMVTDARPGKVVQEIELPLRAERSP